MKLHIRTDKPEKKSDRQLSVSVYWSNTQFSDVAIYRIDIYRIAIYRILYLSIVLIVSLTYFAGSVESLVGA